MPVHKIKTWLFGDESKNSPEAKVDLKKIKPYGDHLGDGAMQLSFTLPLAMSPEAKEAAKIYAERMGLEKVIVASAERIGESFSFFVVYGHSRQVLDFTRVKVPKAEFEIFSREEIESKIKNTLKRKIVVVGATTGSDAHTVGIDAILNRKGYKGDYGLESYQGFKVYNLRAQVENETLLKKAREFKADAILVSKLVTQQDQHLKDLKDLTLLLKKEKGLNPHLIKIVGGPRITHAIAKRAGFDAGFGTGTLPSEVASFIVGELTKKAN
ncbi:MAG: cobalamin-dependent protein [Deltaproteobacteria bacterium]|nr:cobalamin-dependent protein [Deltaproteobacteria bacterium]